jgi:phage I-like protein
MTDKTKSIGIMSAELESADGEFQLLPAGVFKSKDGRPKDAAAYVLEEHHAAALVAQFNAQKNPIAVDYEHQSILTKENGKPAPAAGWVHGLEWRPGKGLFAVQVEWTETAKAAIKANEYRYISPVFTYKPKTGEIIHLFNAALTNTPALDGMEAAVAHSLNFQPSENNQGEQGGENQKPATIVHKEALTLEIAKAQSELERLTAQTDALTVANVALAKQQEEDRLTSLIDGYLEAGRIYPFERDAFLTLAHVNMPALQQVLAPRKHFNWMCCQTDRINTASHIAGMAKPFNLTAADIRACELTGKDPAAYAALKASYFNGENPVHI